MDRLDQGVHRQQPDSVLIFCNHSTVIADPLQQTFCRQIRQAPDIFYQVTLVHWRETVPGSFQKDTW